MKSERDSRIAELEDEVNELHHLLTEYEQATEVVSRENQDGKQLLEETIRQLTYSLEKVAELKLLAQYNYRHACALLYICVGNRRKEKATFTVLSVNTEIV